MDQHDASGLDCPKHGPGAQESLVVWRLPDGGRRQHSIVNRKDEVVGDFSFARPIRVKGRGKEKHLQQREHEGVKERQTWLTHQDGIKTTRRDVMLSW